MTQNAEGLVPSPASFTHFGPSPTTYCEYITKVEGNQSVTINNGKSYWATLIPNSDVG